MNYRLSAVAAVIDPPNASKLATTFRDWIVRGIVQYGPDDLAPVKAGAPALVSEFTALRLALMADLTSLGLAAQDAAFIAGSWSHLARSDRPAGGLYAGDDTLTLLAVWRDRSGELRGRDLPFGHTVTLSRLRWEFGRGTKITGPMLVVDLADVRKRLEPLFETTPASTPAAE